MHLKKIMDYTQFALAILSLLVWLGEVKSDFLTPLFGVNIPFNVYLNFALLFWISIALNLMRWRFGIWFSMLAVIGYMPLIAYQIFVSATLKTFTSILIGCSAVLFFISVTTYIAYLFEKKRANENSPKLERLVAKHRLLRNKLKAFRAGRIYNKIVITSGLLAFALGISILFLGLASISTVNFIQGVNVQVFWMGMIFFFALFSWVAYAKLSIKTMKMLPLLQVLLMFLLIRVIVSFIQGIQVHIENHANAVYVFLIANLILACSLFILEIVEWIGFSWLICCRRAELFLPEYPNSVQRKLHKRITSWVGQIILAILLFLFWGIFNSIPPSESLFVKVQNAPVAYVTDNAIIMKNVQFNASNIS